MSSPAHAVHTIHGTFSGISSHPRLPTPSSYSIYAAVVMNMAVKQPPGLARAAGRIVPVSIPPSCRRLSASPDSRRQSAPRATAAELVHFSHENPFDDAHALPVYSARYEDTVTSYQRTRLASQSFAVKAPRPSHMEALVRQRTAQRLALDREARCKAVAGILLNRVHGAGRPMRRMPPNPEVPRTYKRSRLSTMLTVDDL